MKRKKVKKHKLLFEIDQKEKELTELKVDNELKKLELEKSRVRNIVGVILVVFLIVIVLLTYYAYRLKSKTSKVLFKTNLDLKEQKEELN